MEDTDVYQLDVSVNKMMMIKLYRQYNNSLLTPQKLNHKQSKIQNRKAHKAVLSLRAITSR